MSAGQGHREGAGRALRIVPVTLREARAWVERVHRHHGAPQGGIFAIGCASGDEIVAVAIVGRPVARMAQDGYTAELTRLASDGTRNACSFLYGRAWRAAQALGFRRLITYTLASEDGASLRGAGWRLIGESGGGKWSRQSRPRVDLHPTQQKMRWEAPEPPR